MSKKILVISYALPVRTTGTPVVVRKFLENFSKDEILLLGRPIAKGERLQNYSYNYQVIKIPTPVVGARGERLWRILFAILSIVYGLWLKIFKKYDTILAFYRDGSSLFAGYVLSKITGLPLYSYFCDLYVENYTDGLQGVFAKWLQPRIFNESKHIFVLTEGIQAYFAERYNLNCTVLPHCINEPIDKESYSPAQGSPIKIGYLGSVNIDRVLSLKILCDSINDDSQHEIVYFTTTPEDVLLREGLLISNSKVKRILDSSILKNEISACDILFIPQTHTESNSQREFQLMTGFPTKALEYLISMKPILVHTKKKYFLAKFFSEYQCGLIVEGEKENLQAALDQLSQDEELRINLSKGCANACQYFRGDKIKLKFCKKIE